MSEEISIRPTTPGSAEVLRALVTLPRSALPDSLPVPSTQVAIVVRDPQSGSLGVKLGETFVQLPPGVGKEGQAVQITMVPKQDMVELLFRAVQQPSPQVLIEALKEVHLQTLLLEAALEFKGTEMAQAPSGNALNLPSLSVATTPHDLARALLQEIESGSSDIAPALQKILRTAIQSIHAEQVAGEQTQPGKVSTQVESPVTSILKLALPALKAEAPQAYEALSRMIRTLEETGSEKLLQAHRAYETARMTILRELLKPTSIQPSEPPSLPSQEPKTEVERLLFKIIKEEVIPLLSRPNQPTGEEQTKLIAKLIPFLQSEEQISPEFREHVARLVQRILMLGTEASHPESGPSRPDPVKSLLSDPLISATLRLLSEISPEDEAGLSASEQRLVSFAKSVARLHPLPPQAKRSEILDALPKTFAAIKSHMLQAAAPSEESRQAIATLIEGAQASKQLATITAAIGEAPVLVIPLLIGGFLSRLEISVEEDAERKKRGGGTAAEKVSITTTFPGLGEVSADCEYQGAIVRVNLSFEQPSAADFCRKRLSILAETLRQCGFDSQTLTAEQGKKSEPSWLENLRRGALAVG